MGFLDFGIPIISTAADAYSQHKANKANKKIAREQMAFQERMSNTEMTRRVQDLKNAGLNPMLAAVNQQGASAPQGASADIDPVTRNTASSALAAMAQREQLKNLRAQTDLLTEQKRSAAADATIKENQATHSASSAFWQNATLESTYHEIGARIQNLKKEFDIKTTDLENRRLTNEQMEALNPILVAIEEMNLQYKRLGLTAAEAQQKLEENLGQQGPFIRLLLDIIRSGRRPD